MTSSDPASQSVTRPLDRRLPTAPPRGNLRQLVRDPLGFFHSATSQYGDIVCYRSAPEPANFINHPDYVRHVLLDNNHNYHKVTSSNLLFTIGVG